MANKATAVATTTSQVIGFATCGRTRMGKASEIRTATSEVRLRVAIMTPKARQARRKADRLLPQTGARGRKRQMNVAISLPRLLG